MKNLNIKGEVTIHETRNDDDFAFEVSAPEYSICAIYREVQSDKREAISKLIAESINVANETGLTPRELLNQRNELLEALKGILDLAEAEYLLRSSNGYNEEYLKEDRTLLMNARNAIDNTTK